MALKFTRHEDSSPNVINILIYNYKVNCYYNYYINLLLFRSFLNSVFSNVFLTSDYCLTDESTPHKSYHGPYIFPVISDT